MAAPSVTFTPLAGLLALGQRIATHCGLGEMWAGEDNLEGVLRDKLKQLGVPEKSIALSGGTAGALTPRQLAEQSGFIKRPRPQRRVK